MKPRIFLRNGEWAVSPGAAGPMEPVAVAQVFARVLNVRRQPGVAHPQTVSSHIRQARHILASKLSEQAGKAVRSAIAKAECRVQ